MATPALAESPLAKLPVLVLRERLANARAARPQCRTPYTTKSVLREIADCESALKAKGYAA